MPPKKTTPVDGPAGTREAVMVLIGDLLVLPEYQCRVKTDPGTIKAYADKMRHGVDFPPITVAKVNGAAVVVDGFHRVAAAKAAGHHGISAEIIEATKEEALQRAALANLTHGLPLKSREKREVFRKFIRGRGHRDRKTGALMSYRDLAAKLEHMAAHTTLRGWMESDFPATFRKMGGQDGRNMTGAPDPDTLDPERAFLAEALEGIEKAVNAARGIKDPMVRGTLVRAAREALESIEAAGEWDPREWDPGGGDF